MTTHDYASLVKTVYTAFNDRDFDRAAAVVTNDFEFRMIPTGQDFHGPDGIRQYLAVWADGFPESAATITDVIAGDQKAVVEFTGRGVHSGTLKTPMGDIAPTGNRVELEFCDVWEIVDDKLRRGRTYFDLASLMRQLGMSD